jgi:uncharacterized radical SAM superfamily protein
MLAWSDMLPAIDALDGIKLDADLVAAMQRRAESVLLPSIRFHVPSFKTFTSSEISNCGKSAWPAVSITGGDCKLACDHCKAKILEPMIPARTPEQLWRVANEQIAAGARGMLLTGGSNHRNEVEYAPFYSTIRRIKDAFPFFRTALHTALTDEDGARCMEQAGVDAAMMDVIGAQDTITQVYHLKRSVDDFERTLAALTATRLKVVPHIVLGLHYGRLLGEWHALEIVQHHQPDALVLVAAMPFYAPALRPFVIPNAHEVGRFFLDARKALPDLPLLLGCARPPGRARSQIDAYAVMAGLSGIAHPAEGVVELALRLGRETRVLSSCCSIAVGEEVLAMEEGAGVEGNISIDAQQFIQARPKTIPIHAIGA